MDVDVVHAASITVDNSPWSNYKESDYTLQQWHNACLIHLHSGPVTTKAMCKLPVKTPSGVVNAQAVAAATAALHGARAPLVAPPAQKAAAAKALVRLYNQMGKQPPPSLLHSDNEEDAKAFIEHFGVRGMKWGVRKRSTITPSSDYKKTAHLRNRHPAELSNKQIQKINERINLEQNYRRLNPTRVKRGQDKAKLLLESAMLATTAFAVWHNRKDVKEMIKLGIKATKLG